MEKINPVQEALRHAINAGFKVNFVRHQDAWSVHLFPGDLTSTNSDRSYGGTGTTKEQALAKATSEYVERLAMNEVVVRNRKTLDSTGFAARPLIGWSSIVKAQTRSSAMLEAMERYYGFQWWEDHAIGHQITDLTDRKIRPMLQLNMTRIFEKIFLVHIKTRGFEDVLVLIGMHDKGFLVGCAAGWAWERSKTLYRATVELMRHFYMINNMQKCGEMPSSRYMQKLTFLASGAADDDLKSRLHKRGSDACNRPRVNFDSCVPHQLSNIYYVHRFIFEEQPDILSSNNNIII